MRGGSPPPTCQESCVSHLTCHMLHVKYHHLKKVQTSEAIWWRGYYQRGLPRLVYTWLCYQLLFGLGSAMKEIEEEEHSIT